ncbi:MAG: hypothetical protein IJZ55_11410, partial [Lachnospiraceae bacterium]|nr:hypothetical protein [Lachnospiraceae bacterium]
GRKPEELMTMFSEMLREMDRNTIRYMVDDMKEKIEKGKVELSVIEGKLTETEGKLTETEGKLAEAEKVIGRKDEELLEKDAEIARLQALLKEK